MRSHPAVTAITDALRCIVCHDIVCKPVVLSCDHIFCTECIKGIPPDTNNFFMYKCPLCHAPYSLQRCRPNARLDLIATHFRALLDAIPVSPAVISPVKPITPARGAFITADSLISISDSEGQAARYPEPRLKQPPRLQPASPAQPRSAPAKEGSMPPAAPKKRAAARSSTKNAPTKDTDFILSLAPIPMAQFRRGDAMMQRLETLRVCDSLRRCGFSAAFVEELRSGPDGTQAVHIYNEYLRRYKQMRSDPSLTQNQDLHLYVADIVIRTESVLARAPSPVAAEADMYPALLRQLLARGGEHGRQLRAVLRRVAAEHSTVYSLIPT